jgi:hypothetical protein
MQYQPFDSWKHQHKTLRSKHEAPRHLFNKAEDVYRVTRERKGFKDEQQPMDWAAKYEQWKTDLHLKRVHLELEISHQSVKLQVPTVNYGEKNKSKYPPLKSRKAIYVDGIRPPASNSSAAAAKPTTTSNQHNTSLLGKNIPKEDITTPQRSKQILKPTS